MLINKTNSLQEEDDYNKRFHGKVSFKATTKREGNKLFETSL
jgi:hypothetical protein